MATPTLLVMTPDDQPQEIINEPRDVSLEQLVENTSSRSLNSRLSMAVRRRRVPKGEQLLFDWLPATFPLYFLQSLPIALLLPLLPPFPRGTRLSTRLPQSEKGLAVEQHGLLLMHQLVLLSMNVLDQDRTVWQTTQCNNLLRHSQRLVDFNACLLQWAVPSHEITT